MSTLIRHLKAVAAEKLITLGHHAQLTEAAQLLGRRGHDLVVICNDDELLAGVVTRTDIVSRIGECVGRTCTMPVADVMTREVVACRPDDTVEDVWQELHTRGLVHLPVIDHTTRPIGILSARDVLHALLQEVEYQEGLLRDYVMGVGYR